MNAQLELLRHADPATDEPWSEERITAFVASTTESSSSVGAAPRATRTPRRRHLVVASAAVVAAAAVVVGGVLAPRDGSENPSAVWSFLAVPNAAAADIDAYVASATAAANAPTVPPGKVVYTRTHWETVSVDAGNVAIRSTSDIDEWRGEAIEQSSSVDYFRGVEFFEPGDRARFLRDGGVEEPRIYEQGPTDIGLPAGPRFPDAAYAATLPTDLDVLIERMRTELPLVAPGAEPTVENLELMITGRLMLPWLTVEQRGALLRLLGRLPGGWSVEGPATVNGVEGIRIVRSGAVRGVNAEWTVSVAAPGLLHLREVKVNDRVRANRGVPIGTVMRESTVTRYAFVDRLGEQPPDIAAEEKVRSAGVSHGWGG